jgi:hypothetical protein
MELVFRQVITVEVVVPIITMFINRALYIMLLLLEWFILQRRLFMSQSMSHMNAHIKKLDTLKHTPKQKLELIIKEVYIMQSAGVLAIPLLTRVFMLIIADDWI